MQIGPIGAGRFARLGYRRGSGNEPGNRQRGDTFPATALADEADGFAIADRERDAIDRANARPHPEVTENLGQTHALDQHVLVLGLRRGVRLRGGFQHERTCRESG